MTAVSTDSASRGADRSRQISLGVNAIGKSFGAGQSRRQILADISFDVEHGEFVTVVGPSGAGKTTMLRCLAGLLIPDSGQVTLKGQLVTGPPDGMAVVFQDYSRSLLPWMSVLDNVVLPLRSRGIRRKERLAVAARALDAVGLGSVPTLYPWQLSGGMQQRAAIARALACQPEVLLMDEPFASVDAQTRADLEDLTLRLQREFAMTIVLVTHDIDEAVYLSDRVIVLSGTPTSVTAVVTVDLGSERDQVATKLKPEFGELRAHVLGLVRR